jgi:hypothetical protein
MRGIGRLTEQAATEAADVVRRLEGLGGEFLRDESYARSCLAEIRHIVIAVNDDRAVRLRHDSAYDID